MLNAGSTRGNVARAEFEAMLDVALAEARLGLVEGGIPIGAAVFAADGRLLGSGHNRRVQDDDPSVHGETAGDWGERDVSRRDRLAAGEWG